MAFFERFANAFGGKNTQLSENPRDALIERARKIQLGPKEFIETIGRSGEIRLSGDEVSFSPEVLVKYLDQFSKGTEGFKDVLQYIASSMGSSGVPYIPYGADTLNEIKPLFDSVLGHCGDKPEFQSIKEAAIGRVQSIAIISQISQYINEKGTPTFQEFCAPLQAVHPFPEQGMRETLLERGLKDSPYVNDSAHRNFFASVLRDEPDSLKKLAENYERQISSETSVTNKGPFLEFLDDIGAFDELRAKVLTSSVGKLNTVADNKSWEYESEVARQERRGVSASSVVDETPDALKKHADGLLVHCRNEGEFSLVFKGIGAYLEQATPSKSFDNQVRSLYTAMEERCGDSVALRKEAIASIMPSLAKMKTHFELVSSIVKNAGNNEALGRVICDTFHSIGENNPSLSETLQNAMVKYRGGNPAIEAHFSSKEHALKAQQATERKDKSLKEVLKLTGTDLSGQNLNNPKVVSDFMLGCANKVLNRAVDNPKGETREVGDCFYAAGEVSREMESVFVNIMKARDDGGSFDPFVLKRLVQGDHEDRFDRSEFFQRQSLPERGYDPITDTYVVGESKKVEGKEITVNPSTGTSLQDCRFQVGTSLAFAGREVVRVYEERILDSEGETGFYENQGLLLSERSGLDSLGHGVERIFDKIPEAIKLTACVQKKYPETFNVAAGDRDHQWVDSAVEKIEEARKELFAAQGKPSNAKDMTFVSLKTGEQDHMNRHFKGESLETVGSKFYADARDPFIDAVEKALKEAFEAQKATGDFKRTDPPIVLTFDRPIGTDALVELKGQSDDKLQRVIRDQGASNESVVMAVATEQDKIPQTNIVTVIGGPYGPTGEWGIYTMFPGKEAPPFPSEKQSAEAQASNRVFWEEHGFLATPEEIKRLPVVPEGDDPRGKAKTPVNSQGKYASLPPNKQQPAGETKVVPSVPSKKRDRGNNSSPKI